MNPHLISNIMSFMLITEARQCRAVSKDWNDGFISTGITLDVKDVIITIYDEYEEEWTTGDVADFWMCVVGNIILLIFTFLLVWINTFEMDLPTHVVLGIGTSIVISLGCCLIFRCYKRLYVRVKDKDFSCLNICCPQ
jgi:uncharacterized protein YacL